MITRTAFDRQYEHIGNVRHGVQTGPWRVEFDAPLADDVNVQKIVQGSIVSLNEYGQYVIGGGTPAGANCPVPCISMKNVFDPDVTTGYQGKTMATSTYSAVGGVITAIPATSGYELETTEFDATGTYLPGDLLVPGTGDNLGKVVKASGAAGGSETVIGVVSKAPSLDYFGNTRLAFFSTFIPAGIRS